MEQDTQNDPHERQPEIEAREPSVANDPIPLRESITLVAGTAVLVAATLFGTGLLFSQIYLERLNIPFFEVSLMSWRYNFLGAGIAGLWALMLYSVAYLTISWLQMLHISLGKKPLVQIKMIDLQPSPTPIDLVLSLVATVGFGVVVFCFISSIHMDDELEGLLIMAIALFLAIVGYIAYHFRYPILRRENNAHFLSLVILYFFGLIIITFIEAESRAYIHVKAQAPQVNIRVIGADFYNPTSAITTTILSPNEISYEGMYLLLSDDNQIFLTDSVNSDCQPETVYAMPQSSVTGLEYLPKDKRVDPCPNGSPTNNLMQTPPTPSAPPTPSLPPP